MASKLKVDELAGSAGNTISLASGQTLDTSSGTLTLGTGAVTSAMLAGSIANSKLSNSSITIGDEQSLILFKEATERVYGDGTDIHFTKLTNIQGQAGDFR